MQLVAIICLFANISRVVSERFSVDIKANISAYWHGRSSTYDKFPASHSEVQEKMAYRCVLEGFVNGHGLKILDIGTGTGFMASILAEMGHEIIGLDMAEGMLEKARQKTQGNGHRVSFQLGDAEDLPFEGASFDTVVCRYLLWTLPEPRRALGEWCRVVRPGGSIICIEGPWRYTSIKGRLKRLSRQLGILFHDRANPRKLGYDRETADRLPFRNGLTLEEATGLFREKGLTNIASETLSEVRNIQARNMPLLYRLAMSPPTFLIKGEKAQ